MLYLSYFCTFSVKEAIFKMALSDRAERTQCHLTPQRDLKCTAVRYKKARLEKGPIRKATIASALRAQN